MSRLSMNSITCRGFSIRQLVDAAVAADVRWIAPWRDLLLEDGALSAGRMIRDSGLGVSSLCRGGMFTAADEAGRRAAVADNLRAIDEASALGASTLVLVCGPVVGRDLHGSVSMVRDGIAQIIGHAVAAGVRLGIEPLHPMMASSRSCVTTLRQALDIADALESTQVGVIVDAYHVWSDPHLEEQRERARSRVLGFHVSDWVTPIQHELESRAMPGRGSIDLDRIKGFTDAAGWNGPIEVEVLSQYWWGQGPEKSFIEAVDSYRNLGWD